MKDRKRSLTKPVRDLFLFLCVGGNSHVFSPRIKLGFIGEYDRGNFLKASSCFALGANLPFGKYREVPPNPFKNLKKHV